MDADRLIPLSALQHYLYCPRQCALIHNEQVWAENHFTADGQVLHEKANSGKDEKRPGISIMRTMPVRSEHYGIVGVCDVVEKSSENGIYPVEYKRGKPKSHRSDEVQVCAQALCLEEMFQISIPSGLIFYGLKRRRTEVVFDESLRQLTLDIIAQTHQLFLSRETPPMDYHKQRCDNCSLIDLCMPRRKNQCKSAGEWFHRRLEEVESSLL